MHSATTTPLCPGARVAIRGEEWLVRRVDRTTSGAAIIVAIGTSPLVAGKEAHFIDTIERRHGGITPLDPSLTQATLDTSPGYIASRLTLECQLRASIPASSDLQLGPQGAMDVLPYQLQPAELALTQARPRLLIADAVGLGKTIECGILLAELLKRGRGQRILVVTVKAMLTQFQKELWSRFTIPLVRLDSTGLQRVRRRIPSHHNPFHYYDKSIISIDTLKQDGEYRNLLESAWWDIIVMDEAHHVAERGASQGENSQRSRTARLLASRSDALILLSATPHDGKRASFASLMRMLDPTAIADPSNYGPGDIAGLYIRRFKKDIKDQLKAHFPERIVHTLHQAASPQEEKAFQQLGMLSIGTEEKSHLGARLLFRTLLEKALFSSPAACITTAQERLTRLNNQNTTPSKECESLEAFLVALRSITPSAFSKYQHLLALLQQDTKQSIHWQPQQVSDRLVIFTERLDTLDFLHQNLPADLGLRTDQVAILHGALADTEQQAVVEAFSATDSPIRLLIASDVAAEGINLHHQSHRLIHFDIPWSLLTFQQRNGRIDRYGQSHQPQIYYLLTDSSHEKIRGDQRILELLIARDEEVQRNLGDPSEFTGYHDIASEEQALGRVIETTPDASQAEPLLPTAYTSNQEKDWFHLLFQTPDLMVPIPVESAKHSLAPSLYKTDFHWAREGLEYLQTFDPSLEIRVDEPTSLIQFSPPQDLHERLNSLLPEAFPQEKRTLSLTTDREALAQEIIQTRSREGLWPRRHLLWELHPALQWMQDKLLSLLSRNEAPCLHIPHLPPQQCIVLGTGILSNLQGHAIQQNWLGIRFQTGIYQDTLTLEDTLHITRLREGQPSPITSPVIDTTAVATLFPEAIKHLHSSLIITRDTLQQQNEDALNLKIKKLESHLKMRCDALALALAQSLSSGLPTTRAYKVQKHDEEIRTIHQEGDHYRKWITENLHIEEHPTIRLHAVLGNFTPALSV